MAGNNNKKGGLVVEGESLRGTDIQGRRDEYKFQTEQASSQRDDVIQRNVLNIGLVFLWTLPGILLVTIVIFAWHKLSPYDMHFLRPEQISSIQIFLLSSALTSFLTSFAKASKKKYKLEWDQ